MALGTSLESLVIPLMTLVTPLVIPLVAYVTLLKTLVRYP